MTAFHVGDRVTFTNTPDNRDDAVDGEAGLVQKLDPLGLVVSCHGKYLVISDLADIELADCPHEGDQADG
jgi:hypothetical protein